MIERHPGVSEAAVIGVPDPEWGEVVRAVVIPENGADISEDEIISFCDRKLAGYKRPASVVFTGSIPVWRWNRTTGPGSRLMSSRVLARSDG